MDARVDGRVEGIVWLEKGDEVAFEPSGPRRPWLEESSNWGQPDAPNRDEDAGDEGDDAPTLVWL